MNFYNLMSNPEVRAQVATRYGLATTASWSSIEITLEAASAPAAVINSDGFQSLSRNL